MTDDVPLVPFVSNSFDTIKIYDEITQRFYSGHMFRGNVY